MRELYVVYTGTIDVVMEDSIEKLLKLYGWIRKEVFILPDGERQMCFDKENE